MSIAGSSSIRRLKDVAVDDRGLDASLHSCSARRVPQKSPQRELGDCDVAHQLDSQKPGFSGVVYLGSHRWPAGTRMCVRRAAVIRGGDADTKSLDTNILLCAADEDCREHDAALRLVNDALGSPAEWRLADGWPSSATSRGFHSVATSCAHGR